MNALKDFICCSDFSLQSYVHQRVLLHKCLLVQHKEVVQRSVGIILQEVLKPWLLIALKVTFQNTWGTWAHCFQLFSHPSLSLLLSKFHRPRWGGLLTAYSVLRFTGQARGERTQDSPLVSCAHSPLQLLNVTLANIKENRRLYWIKIFNILASHPSLWNQYPSGIWLHEDCCSLSMPRPKKVQEGSTLLYIACVPIEKEGRSAHAYKSSLSLRTYPLITAIASILFCWLM